MNAPSSRRLTSEFPLVRRPLAALTVAAGVAAFLAVPVLSRPVATAHAVTPHVISFALPARSTSPGVLARVDRAHTRTFQLVGATWRAGTLDPGSTSIEVQVHRLGHWSGWTALAPEDGGADGGTADARRAARVHATTQTAEPVWVGAADGVRARVVGIPRPAPSLGGVVPSGLRVVLVDGGTSAADAHPQPSLTFGAADAQAAEPQPTIYTRADWGADESLRRNACPNGPDYAPTVEMGFIHHTETGNGYSRGQVPGIIRSIYAYHVQGNGWCDVGYNYLVDRFGRIWEGRYGGITKAVIGAHTGGYNYDSFGTSLIGSYTSVHPSAAMLSAVEHLFAWKLGSYYRDPTGTARLTAASFSGSRYSAGTDVTFKTVSGHRDADFTTCPGGAAYADLPEIRSGIAAALGAGFVAPAATRPSATMGDGSIGVAARVVGQQSWRLTVADSTGQTIRSVTGTAGRHAPVAASWDLTRTDGTLAPPGAYTVRLTGKNSDGVAARPWSTAVTVTPPVSLEVPAQTVLGSPVKAHGTGIAGHTVTVSVLGAGGSQQLGSFPVSAAGKWSAASVPVSASADLTWTVSDPSVPGYQRNRKTRVGPAVTTPTGTTSFVTAGSPLAVQGTALPAAATVHLMTQPVGAPTPTAGADVGVTADGSWATQFTPTQPTSYWVEDSRGLASRPGLVYPVAAPAATAPSAGYAGRHVMVRGNAGGAPVDVTLSARQPGASWAVVRTVTADVGGRYSARLPLADQAGAATKWKVSTSYGAPVTGSVSIQPVFAPTITAPARVGWDAAHVFSGTAVPGDKITVWTAPVGSTAWIASGTARAASDASWTLPVRFTRDTQWRVTSPSGTSSTGTSVVVPTIHAPASVAARGLVVVRGRGIPGRKLTLYRQYDGAADWSAVATLDVGADGTWAVNRHPRHPVSFRAVSHGQTSRTVSVSIE